MQKSQIIFISFATCIVVGLTCLYVSGTNAPLFLTQEIETSEATAPVQDESDRKTRVTVSNEKIGLDAVDSDHTKVTLRDYDMSITVPNYLKAYLVKSEYSEERDEIETNLFLCSSPLWYQRENSQFVCPGDGIQIQANADGIGGGCGEVFHKSLEIDSKTFTGCWYDTGFSLGSINQTNPRINLRGRVNGGDLFTENAALSILSTITFGQ